MPKRVSENRSNESSAEWSKRMLAKIKGWYQVFSIETGGPEWRDDLLNWESRFGRTRTEVALTEAHYRASDFNHFTAALVMGCIPPASGRREANPNCSDCGGSGMKPKRPRTNSDPFPPVTNCDCLETPPDFKERQASAGIEQ